MNVGLRGFGKVGMFFTYLVSQHGGMNIVITDTLSPDEKLDDYSTLGIGEAQAIDGKLVIGDKFFDWFVSDFKTAVPDIAWPDGLDCIVEAAVTPPGSELAQHLQNAPYVIQTGTPKPADADYFMYNEGASEKFNPAVHRVISFGNDRSQVVGPVVSLLKEKYGPWDFTVSVVREPYSLHSIDQGVRVDELEGVDRAMPEFSGGITEHIFFDSRYEIATLVLTYNVAGGASEIVEDALLKFPKIFGKDIDPRKELLATIEPATVRAEDRIGFKIHYHTSKLYTKLLYNFMTQKLVG